MSSPCRSPLDVLRTRDVEHVVIEHAPIRGYADVERVLGLPPDRLLKTMVFRDTSGGFLLVALPAGRRVSYGRLARATGIPRARLRQADAGDLAQLNMEPGGASPVCGAGDVVTVFDSSVSGMGRVYCGSGRADRTVETDVAALLDVVRPTVADVCAEED